MLHTKIAFREVGEGPILILLHGYAGSVLHWDPIVASLKSNYRVVIPNLSHLFMGKNPLKFSEQVDAFAEFVRTRFPDQKVHLTGISYGAAVVWGVALKYPELVDRTVFINPMPPEPVQAFNIPILKTFFQLPLNLHSIYLILRTPLGRFFLKRAAEVFRIERAEFWDKSEDLHGRKLLFVCHVIHNFAYILKNENWSNWKKLLKEWSHKSLLVFDVEDPLFKPRTYYAFQELLSCEATSEVKKAGHIAIQTRPEEIALRMKDFLDVERSTTAA